MSHLFFLSGRRVVGALAATAACLLLTACGGGGGGDAAALAPASKFEPSSTLAGVCTMDGEEKFARSYLDEAYLWADRVQEVDRTQHASVQSYFNALLVRTPDASGRPTDRFSTVLSGGEADTMLSASSDPASLIAASAAVPRVTTVRSPKGRLVGYLQLDKDGRGAQDELIPAFEALRDARIEDLVLDLRNNPGGYLYVAQAAASMIAGPAQTGQLFEQLRYSPERAAAGAGSSLNFVDTVQKAEQRYPAGYPLPQLALPRVYVLASGVTCSASESIVNSLRGVGIEVILVGDTTCGKPYGFHRQDNCDKSYFAIEFQGFNAAGFGGYSGGFAPQCPVQENAAATLGSPREPLLAAALQHIDTGSCPPASAPKSRRQPAPADLFSGRLLTAD